MDLSGSTRWDEIFEPLPLGACLVGEGFRVLNWNTCLEEWTGISKERSLGQDIRSLFPHLQAESYPHLIRALLVNGSPGLHHDLMIEPVPLKPFPDPMFLVRQISISILSPGREEGYRVLFLFAKGIALSDQEERVTELMEEADAERTRRIEAERSLEIKSEELVRANRDKFRFLSDMSHELRTPLNSILLLAKLFTQKDASNLTEKQKEFVATIHAAGTDLLKLINDILDHSKAESGKMQVERSWVDPRHICAKMMRYFKNAAEEKGLSFSIDPAECDYLEISTDAQMLEQILKNLISNALKFTADGNVRLTVARITDPRDAEGDPPRNGILFSLSDTGPGIEKDKQELVFDAFRQLQDRRFQISEGTGLGLAISRKFAELMGGSLVLDSEPGVGSTFSLFLPEEVALPWKKDGKECSGAEERADLFDCDSSCTRGGTALHASEILSIDSKSAVEFFDQDKSMLSGRKMLVLGNDMRGLFTLSNTFEKHRMHVVVCKGVSQALENLRNDSGIDLVLFDAESRIKSAVDAVKKLCARTKMRGLPLLVLLPQVTVSELDLFMRAGATDCLLKPMDHEQLIQKMLSSMALPASG